LDYPNKHAHLYGSIKRLNSTKPIRKNFNMETTINISCGGGRENVDKYHPNILALKKWWV